MRVPMVVTGLYLVYGAKREPGLRLLNDTRRAWLDDGLSIASDAKDPEASRTYCYEQAFGKGAEFALPAWIPQCMTAVIDSGERVPLRARQLAACLLTGKNYCGQNWMPWEERPKGGDDKGNGDGARLVKPKPRKPPGGVSVKPVRGRKTPAAKLKPKLEVVR